MCQVCDTVCHDGCAFSKDEDIEHCVAFNGASSCSCCAGGCGATFHKYFKIDDDWRCATRVYRRHLVLSTSNPPAPLRLHPALSGLARRMNMVSWLEECWGTTESDEGVTVNTDEPIICPEHLAVPLERYFNVSDDNSAEPPAPTAFDDQGIMRRGTGLVSTSLEFYMAFHICKLYGILFTMNPFGLSFHQISCRVVNMRPVTIGSKTYVARCLERCVLVMQGGIPIFVMSCYEFCKGNGIPRNDGRVYIAYLDSTGYFQLPRTITLPPGKVFSKGVFLHAYADYVAALGFNTLHLWSAAPWPQPYYLLPRAWDEKEARVPGCHANRQKKLDDFYVRAFSSFPFRGPAISADEEATLGLEFPLFPADYKLRAFINGSSVARTPSCFVVDLRVSKWHRKYFEDLRRVDIGAFKRLLRNGDYTTHESALSSGAVMLAEVAARRRL